MSKKAVTRVNLIQARITSLRQSSVLTDKDSEIKKALKVCAKRQTARKQ